MAKLPVSKKVKLRFKKKTGAGVANDKDSRETVLIPIALSTCHLVGGCSPV